MNARTTTVGVVTMLVGLVRPIPAARATDWRLGRTPGGSCAYGPGGAFWLGLFLSIAGVVLIILGLAGVDFRR